MTAEPEATNATAHSDDWPWRRIAKAMRRVAREAGALVEQIKAEGFTAELKEDGSLVTRGDRASEELIRARLAEELRAIMPEDGSKIGFLGEEAVEAGERPDLSSGAYFVVDPIDGTRNYVEDRLPPDRYMVLIGLVVDGRPTLGVSYDPRDNIEMATVDRDAVVLSLDGATDIPLVPGVDKDHRGRKLPVFGAGPLRYADMIRGEIPRVSHRGGAFEWDTAAPHAAVHAAGGEIESLEGGPMRYGKEEVKYKNSGFRAVMPDPAPRANLAITPHPKRAAR